MSLLPKQIQVMVLAVLYCEFGSWSELKAKRNSDFWPTKEKSQVEPQLFFFFGVSLWVCGGFFWWFFFPCLFASFVVYQMAVMKMEYRFCSASLFSC